MLSSKRNKSASRSKTRAYLLAICLTLSACQTTSRFHLQTFHTQAGDLQVIHTHPSRVRQQCLFLDAEAENNWRHQYYLRVLSDQGEVLEIIYALHQDKESCESLVKAVEKILRSGSMTKICARHELEKITPDPEIEPISFGSLGKHRPSYAALFWDSICGSNGCFKYLDTWINTCPGFEDAVEE